MLPYKIKAKLIDREGSLNAVAAKLGISKVVLSQTINCHKAHHAVRQSLKVYYGVVITDRKKRRPPKPATAAAS